MFNASSLGGGSEKLADSSLSVAAPLLSRFGFTPQLSFTYDPSASNGLPKLTISFLIATTAAFVTGYPKNYRARRTWATGLVMNCKQFFQRR